MLVATVVLGKARWSGRIREHLAVDAWAIPGRAPVAAVRLSTVILGAAFIIGAIGTTSLA